MAASFHSSVYQLLFAVTLSLIVVLLLRRLFARAFGARIAYCMWIIVPLSALAALLPSSGLSIPPPLQLPEFVTVPQISDYSLTASTSVPARSEPSSIPWILILWLGGASTVALVQLVQQRAFVRRLGHLRPLEGGEWVVTSSDIGPAVVGALSPKVVLPADFAERYNAAERRLILEHERMHIARHDPFMNLLVALIRSALWFHPLVHIAAQSFRLDQELACDAAVLKGRSREIATYAQAILKTHIGPLELPAGCRWESHSTKSLKRRISMLKFVTPSRVRRVLGLVAMSTVVTTTSAIAWAAKSPEAVATSAAASEALLISKSDVQVYEMRFRILRDGVEVAQPSANALAGQAATFELKPTEGANGYLIEVVPKALSIPSLPDGEIELAINVSSLDASNVKSSLEQAVVQVRPRQMASLDVAGLHVDAIITAPSADDLKIKAVCGIRDYAEFNAKFAALTRDDPALAERHLSFKFVHAFRAGDFQLAEETASAIIKSARARRDIADLMAAEHNGWTAVRPGVPNPLAPQEGKTPFQIVAEAGIAFRASYSEYLPILKQLADAAAEIQPGENAYMMQGEVAMLAGDVAFAADRVRKALPFVTHPQVRANLEAELAEMRGGAPAANGKSG